MSETITRVSGSNHTVYMPEKVRETTFEGERYSYIPINHVSTTLATNRDAKSQTAHIFMQRVKKMTATKGVWVPQTNPNGLEISEEKKIITAKELEKLAVDFSKQNTSRLMTLSEALLLLEYIRQQEERTVEELTSIQGIENAIIPYFTNREHALLVKTQTRYAVLGAGKYYKHELPATDVREIEGNEHIDIEIKPIVVLEGIPIQ